MKVVIDILTPKQCLFFEKLYHKLQLNGHDVLLTTRQYREVNPLLEKKGLEAVIVGKHGGRNLKEKLLSSSSRILELTPIMEKYNPDMSVSFSSPEMARVSFGLGVPHVCISDSPHAVAVSKLTIPLSVLLLAPKMISTKEWEKYGIPKNKIVQYNALDPWAWLKDFTPDEKILKSLGLKEGIPIVTIRSAETYAAYLLGKKTNSITMDLAKKIVKTKKDIQVVVIPRYAEQLIEFQKYKRDKIVILDKIIDGPSLLFFTSIFIGAGGTMSAEAALMGIPTISCYPGDPYIIENYLIEKGLINRETSEKKLFKKVMNMLKNYCQYKKETTEKSTSLIETFEDPIEVIVNEIEKIGR